MLRARGLFSMAKLTTSQKNDLTRLHDRVSMAKMALSGNANVAAAQNHLDEAHKQIIDLKNS